MYGFSTFSTTVSITSLSAGLTMGPPLGARLDIAHIEAHSLDLDDTREVVEQVLALYRLSSPFGGDSSVGERDRDARAAEVDHRDQGIGGVESVGAV